jgi:hypothetical protein
MNKADGGELAASILRRHFSRACGNTDVIAGVITSVRLEDVPVQVLSIFLLKVKQV